MKGVRVKKRASAIQSKSSAYHGVDWSPSNLKWMFQSIFLPEAYKARVAWWYARPLLKIKYTNCEWRRPFDYYHG
jgi:hypothetical protein